MRDITKIGCGVLVGLCIFSIVGLVFMDWITPPTEHERCSRGCRRALTEHLSQEGSNVDWRARLEVRSLCSKECKDPLMLEHGYLEWREE